MARFFLADGLELVAGARIGNVAANVLLAIGTIAAFRGILTFSAILDAVGTFEVSDHVLLRRSCSHSENKERERPVKDLHGVVVRLLSQGYAR